MAFQYNHYYEIYNGGKYVNLNGDHENDVVNNGEKVTMYARTNNPDQRWALERYGSDNQVRIVLQRGGGWYALNYNTENTNCIVWHLNSAADKDTVITLEPAVSFGGVYRLKLAQRNLYLTVVGSSLKWMAFTNKNDQAFSFVEPGSDSSSTGFVHEIKMPYNYNQKEGPSSGFRNAGCACTCGMDIASFYSGEQYTFAQFRQYYTDHSNNTDGGYIVYNWGTPKFTLAADKTVENASEEATIAHIKRYIAQGTPVACHCLPVTLSEHWVVPYAYENKAGWESIRVLDPYQGVKRTMAEAMNLSCGGTSGGVNRIMCNPNYLLTNL